MTGLEGLPLGEVLRDAALAQHASRHQEDIQRVRLSLLALRQKELTGDDASRVADQLGLPQGERRWLGQVFRHWPRVRGTDRTTPSTLARRHARRLQIWEVL